MNPLSDMRDQMRRMDALFNHFFGFDPLGGALQQESWPNEPEADVYESDNEYIVHAALPGIEPNDIQIDATEEGFTLTARRSSPFGAGQQQGGGQTAGQGQSGQMGGQMQGSQQSAPEQVGSQPHTQHRQSRYSSQSEVRLAYTFPSPVDPNSVRASIRNGMLELHLPKLQTAANRAIRVPVQGFGGDGSEQSDIGGTREGAPGNKMGQSYTPTAGEDHTAQAQAAGERPEHEPGRTGAASQQQGASVTPQPEKSGVNSG